MSLTKKSNQSRIEKKIKAKHHRHSKSYLKSYWPYIPILLILAIGFIANLYWPAYKIQHTPQLVAYTYYYVLESSIGLIALSIFMLRHAFAWHKVFVYGEDFVTKHPLLDIVLVSIATVGLLLSSKGAII